MAMKARDNGSKGTPRSVKIGDSEIRPIPDHGKKHSAERGSIQEDGVTFTPGGKYRPEKFPELERVLKSWRDA